MFYVMILFRAGIVYLLHQSTLNKVLFYIFFTFTYATRIPAEWIGNEPANQTRITVHTRDPNQLKLCFLPQIRVLNTYGGNMATDSTKYNKFLQIKMNEREIIGNT